MMIMCARCRLWDDVGCSSELCESKEVGPLCDNATVEPKFYDCKWIHKCCKARAGRVHLDTNDGAGLKKDASHNSQTHRACHIEPRIEYKLRRFINKMVKDRWYFIIILSSK